jgi:tRNA-2-methylthio-N6-dimethylallyladenosine synthase
MEGLSRSEKNGRKERGKGTCPCDGSGPFGAEAFGQEQTSRPDEKRVYIETYGCQMNEHDSERILRILEELSYSETTDFREADLILINTCSVREKAELKVYSALGRFKSQKEETGAILGVTGCVAQQEGSRLLHRVPYLDMVVGTQAIPLLPQLLRRVAVSGQRVCVTGMDGTASYLGTVLPRIRPLAVKSYVTIMQGCDRFCSFCIVPYVRGREKSRPSGEIIEEVKGLVGLGVHEVCLLGQNVNAYGKGLDEKTSFSELLARINDIDGLQRIRFTTSHPADLSEDLIQSFSGLRKVCEHIHLPFQSGSDKILKAMHRGYTKHFYLDKVERLRDACASIAITSDVIVGFPGEGEEDFRETLDLIRAVRFDDLFSFKYSPRTGTRAAAFPDQVPAPVKRDRLAVLQALQQEITIGRNKALEGLVEEVLVEGMSKQSRLDLTGRTGSNKVVNFEGDPCRVGTLMPVRILVAYPHSLRGEALETPCPLKSFQAERSDLHGTAGP